MSDPQATTLAGRSGLPAEMLYLRDNFVRARWSEPSLHEVARHWLAMHDGFRAQARQMTGVAGDWQAGFVDARSLHARLIPTLQAFLQHLDAHHRIESDHYFPAMRRMEPRIQAGIDLLDRDHDAIHALLETLFITGSAFHQAIATASPDAGDHASRLTDAIASSTSPVLRHLEDEEDIVIPLIALRGDPMERR